MKDLFTLGFTPFNIFMSLVMIAVVSWLIHENFYKIEEMIRAQLEKSLNRLFEGPQKQPLYKVFYGFNHSSTEAWVAWLKTQSTQIQERAFQRLADYLQEPPNELGSITVEVVKAVGLLEHPESYGVLENLLVNSRNKWAQFKALNLFYGLGAKGLLRIDPLKAKQSLLSELAQIKDIPNADLIKMAIFSALIELPELNERQAIFKSILLDKQHSLSLKAKIFSLIKESEEGHDYFMAKNLCQALLDNVSPFDEPLFEYCINYLKNFIDLPDQREEVWSMIIASCKNNQYSKKALAGLSQNIKSPGFKIEEAHILTILKELDDAVLTELKASLGLRFSLNETEKTIVSESGELEALIKNNLLQDGVYKWYDRVVDLELPASLEANYEKLRKLFAKKVQGINLITGEAADDKMLLIKTYAKDEAKKLAVVDAQKILLSPDMLNQFVEELKQNKPCILFFTNFETYLQALASGVENSRIRVLANLFKSLYADSRVKVIADLDIDSADLQDNHQELFALLDPLPNELFAQKINLGSISARERKSIYSQYEMNLDEKRPVEIESVDEILTRTEGFSNTKYMLFLLRFMKESLLSHGKIIPLANYEEFNKKDDKEGLAI